MNHFPVLFELFLHKSDYVLSSYAVIQTQLSRRKRRQLICFIGQRAVIVIKTNVGLVVFLNVY